MKRVPISVAVVVSASAPFSAAQELAEGAGVPQFAPVTWERLLAAADEPHNWLMYSGTLDSKRFSRLDQVDRSNVADLELKWAYMFSVNYFCRLASAIFAGSGRRGSRSITMMPVGRVGGACAVQSGVENALPRR